MLSRQLRMFFVFLSTFLFASTVCSAPAGCSVGSTVDKGRYWYTCGADGMLAIKGCLSNKNVRLNIGQTFRYGGYVMECASDSDTAPTFKYKGCVSEEGKEYLPTESWQDKNYWYQCEMVSGFPSSQIKGCVDLDKRYNVGESVFKSDLIYTCAGDPNGNMGWNIFPNLAYTGAYDPNQDHIHYKQVVPPMDD